jgi:hypothetical protein
MSQRLLLSLVIIAAAAITLLTGCPKPAGQQAQAPPARNHAPMATPNNPARPGLPPGAPVPEEKPAEKPKGEQPVEPEKNPTGAIPSNQAFVTYKSTAGMYSIQAPEGWTRTESGTDVMFVDKLDGLQVSVTKCKEAPTVESMKDNLVPVVEREGHAVKVTEMRSKKMPNGDTACITVFTSNSNPDPVTKKQVRLNNIIYYYYMPGMLAKLQLWAPVGVDNANPWKLISESFAWSK